MLTDKDVITLANLAKLPLKPEEVETYRRQLESVVEYVAAVQEVNVEGVDEMARVDDAMHLRADVPQPDERAARLVEAAPKHAQGLVITPAVRNR